MTAQIYIKVGLGWDGWMENSQITPYFFPSATLSLKSCSGWFCVNETFRRVLLLPRCRNSMPRSGFHSQTICTALHTCTSLSCTLLHTAHCAHCVAHCTSYLHFVELHTAQCCCCYPGELHCNLWHSSVSLFQVTVRGRHGHGHKCYLSFALKKKMVLDSHVWMTIKIGFSVGVLGSGGVYLESVRLKWGGVSLSRPGWESLCLGSGSVTEKSKFCNFVSLFTCSSHFRVRPICTLCISHNRAWVPHI